MTVITSTEADRRIKELCTEEFLKTLTEVAKCSGWSQDYTEVIYFIQNITGLTDFKVPTYEELKPYELDYQ